MQSSPNATDVGYQVNRLAKLMRSALSAEISELGLTAQQGAVLLHIDEDERVTIGAIADRIGVDRPTMTGLVDRLVRDGWLEVGPNPEDGRSRLVHLAQRARSVKPALAHASHQVTDRALHGLNEAESAVLAELLDRIAQNMGGTKEPRATSARGESA